MKNMNHVGESLLPVIAYGDAAGLPFEAKRFGQVGAVSALCDTRTNPYIGAYPAGTWSDDTHLSIVVARSLYEGFDLHTVAQGHVDALRHVKGATDIADLIPPIVTDEKQNGWGGSTTRAVGRLAVGVEPTESGEVQGAGNGVLMKLAPLVYWQKINDIPLDQRREQVVALTRMTHADPAAVVASLTHQAMLRGLLDMSAQEFRPAQFLQTAAQAAEYFEMQQGAAPVLSRMLATLHEVHDVRGIAPEDIVAVAPKRGFFAPETLAMSYGSFTRETIFPASVYRAVELGGDTDSIGSITGTLSLFLYGDVAMPSDYEHIFDHDRLERLSRLLAASGLHHVMR